MGMNLRQLRVAETGFILRVVGRFEMRGLHGDGQFGG